MIFNSLEYVTLDTFRINLLINLKAFFIHEMIDLLPDKEIMKLIIFSNYNRIINKCCKYLKNTAHIFQANQLRFYYSAQL